MTANASPDDQAACRQAGMDDFVAKPLDAEAFLVLVETYMAGGPDDPVVREAASHSAGPQGG